MAVTVAIPPHHLALVDAEADAFGLSRAQVLRLVLRRHYGDAALIRDLHPGQVSLLSPADGEG